MGEESARAEAIPWEDEEAERTIGRWWSSA